jgi:glycosyltransferase involved in cell wall biosynthesis
VDARSRHRDSRQIPVRSTVCWFEVATDVAQEQTTGARGAALRICVLTDCAYGVGGMQRATHDLVRMLVGAGHEVDVICPAHPTLDPDAHGATWHLLDTPGRTDRRWREKYRAAYLALDAERAFDVAHSESSAAHGLLFKPAVRTPVVVRWHGAYTSLAKAHLRRSLMRPSTAHSELNTLRLETQTHLARGNAWIFRRCVSISVSHDQVDPNHFSAFVPRSIIHVVPNGIDTDLYCPRDREPLRRKYELPEGPLLVAAGRLNREKGFDVAIRTIAALAERGEHAHLLLVGDGEQLHRLKALTARTGVADKVLFLGPRPPEQVAELLAAADVFLFPTRRHEAGPMVLLEGMASGVPTVSTPLGGVTEVVAPPGAPPAGILVKPDDVEALAGAIRSILGDRDLARELGRRARERILEEYTLEQMLERTVAVYRLAIDRAAAMAAA